MSDSGAPRRFADSACIDDVAKRVQALVASRTRIAICTRLVTLSLLSSRDTCALTVASLMWRRPRSRRWSARTDGGAHLSFPVGGRGKLLGGPLVPIGGFAAAEVGQQGASGGGGDDGVTGGHRALLAEDEPHPAGEHIQPLEPPRAVDVGSTG